MSSSQKQKNSPAVVLEIDRTDLYGRYLLKAAAEIDFVLRLLIRHHTLLTVYFDEGRSFFVSCLLALDENRRTLILDVGNEPSINDRLLATQRLVASADIDKVKTQFILDRLQPTTHDGKPAFISALPERLLRLQRREYFRLDIPLSEPLHCDIPLPRFDEKLIDMPLTVPLQDISGGGMSIVVPNDLKDQLPAGILLQNCRLNIPGESPILVNIRVKGSYPAASKTNGEQTIKLGCEFVSLPGTRLTTIQRYINRIERERKARLSGLQ